MKRLVLFDIDGTLLAPKGVGRRAMALALSGVVGSGASMDGVPLAGLCDWGTWRSVLGSHGHTPDQVDARLPEFFGSYLAALRAVLADSRLPQPEVLPGASALLTALHARDDVLLGLITGNVEEGAWLKLRSVGLDRFFRFGAFGNEAFDRANLPALALQRAARFAPDVTFTGKRIVILGDTVHDIRCGAALGVRAIGVATGPDDAATLHAAGADMVFDSLEDRDAVLKAILATGPE